jgi:eukaryotic-like serine/threonine-protein kinase
VGSAPGALFPGPRCYAGRTRVIDIGSVVNGKYRLVRLLGDGGMGSVYEALHNGLGTRVAIKVLHPELNRRTGLVERFLQEARVSAQIRSPHVVQVTDVDRTPEGQAYIVMELLEGEALSTVLDRQRKLPVPVAVEYTIQILEALEAAHALGVIHRDLKPENVFVTFVGGKPVLKLIDFGIAKARRTELQKSLTVAGVVMGTAEYMAPEQAYSADKVDARADLYAVGVMLYEAIAGARPVSGEDARVIALKVERGEVIPLVQVAPDTPREIAGLVHRAMAARPAMRFANATEMRLALLGTGAGRRPGAGAAANAPAPAPPPASPPQRAGASGTELLGAGSVAVAATGPHTPVKPSDPEPPIDTIRAPPIATALTPSPYHGGPGPMPPAPPTDTPRRRRSRGPVVALVALPVLIGAGVVALVVGAGAWTSSGSAPPIAPDPAPASATAAAVTPAPAPADPSAKAASAAVPVLAPTRAAPARPGATPRPAGSGPTTMLPDAGMPPTIFPPGLPSSLPPFPTALPSGLALPSGFPTTLPSAFPSVLPAWPPPMNNPPPAPAAPAHSTNSGDPSY